MSLLTLPEPANWPTGGRRLVRITVVVIVFVALGLFAATRDLLRGQPLSALVIVGILLPFLLILVAVHRVARGRTALRMKADATGTEIRADRTFTVLVLLALAVLIPVGLVMIVATMTGDLELFTSARARIVSAVLMGAASVIAALGLVSAWRRRGVGSVTLTPDGIEIADIIRTTRVAWSDVVAIDDHSGSKKTRKALVLRRSDEVELTIDGADFYVPRGAGLYWMVRHYWKRPERRSELVDGRAARRLSEGRFQEE